MKPKVLHKRSNSTISGGGALVPASSALSYGEIAINYKDGKETLFIKNDSDEVVAFESGEHVWERGTGENSIQQKGTGAVASGSCAVAEGSGTKATGDGSHAEGHGEIQLLQGGITRNGSEIIDSVSYPKYIVEYSGENPERLRIGQTISSNQNGENLRKIIKLTAISDNRDDILLDSALSPETVSENNLYIVTGVAYGDHSHAEGNGCFSLSNSSHAEGTGAVALGKYAHAEGLETLAEGNRSHAEGAWTKASSYEAHAEGQYSEVRTRASHAEGYKSITSCYCTI